MSERTVYNAILKRRSIRDFLDTPVERDKIELMLKDDIASGII